MRLAAFAVTLALLAPLAFAQPADKPDEPAKAEKEKKPRDVEHYQLGKDNLALSGYDPISYFEEGDDKPEKGSKKITFVYDQVLYRFASEEHREMFKEDPQRYEPAYGGWCAYAMAKHDYTKPSPKRFLIQDGRLMLFYDGWGGDTYKYWHKEGPEKLEKLADEYWEKETGEKPPSKEDEKNKKDKDDAPKDKPAKDDGKP